VVLVNAAVIPIGHEPDPAKALRLKHGQKIADVRAFRGVSREELAAAVEVTAAAVGQWERGETSPRPHKQIAIARALDVPHAVLFPMEAA
jgi:transcriptional regulator with XRE-family HTH domain